MENLYEVLEVSPNASKEVIEKAYKVLVKRYHPDVASNKQDADKMIKKINNAYSILSDNTKRKQYDVDFYQFKQVSENINQNSNSNYSCVHTNIDENVYEPKNIKIDNRVLIGLIVTAVIFLIIACTNLYTTISQIIKVNNNDIFQDVNYINDPKYSLIVESITDGFNNLDIDKITHNIVDKEYFNKFNIGIIKDNMDIYKLMLSNLTIKVNGVKATDDRAQIQVSITRNKVEDIFIQYYFSRNMGVNKLTSKQEKELLLKSIESNSKEVTVSSVFNSIKVDGQWLVKLTDLDILNILGISLTKYIDVFDLIE